MKTLRRILLIIIVLILGIVGIGFLLPKHVRIERSLLMKANREAVFEQVNTISNWRRWSPWLRADTLMKIVYSGPKRGVDAQYSWKSENKNIGNGKITIVESAAYDSIMIEMDFLENGKSSGIFRFALNDSGTLVTWIIESELGNNPISRWFGLVMDQMAGKDLEQGLIGINNIAVLMHQPKNIILSETEVPDRIVLSIRDTCTPATLNKKIEKIFGKVSALIKQKKLIVAGAPFTIYHSVTPEFFDIESGIPVSENINLTGEVICKVLPSTKTVKASYLGSYDKIAIAYNLINKYLDDKNLYVSGSPWEVYLTNPQTEPDASKWQTDIYFPVK